MKSVLFSVFCMMMLSTLSIGCAEPESNDPPVLTALDEMDALEDEKQAEARRIAEERAAAALEAGKAAAAEGDAPAETGTYRVEFDTTVGKFTIEVHRAWAPLGAQRFYDLVKDRFYDDAGFFRVVPGFVVQWGLAADPTLTAKWDTAIPDEPVVESNEKGYVTFAKGGPNSRTTQVFINYGSNSRLDAMGFPPFGKVIDGMDVVQKISAAHGETPDQQQLTHGGNSYLKANFPKLDYIKTARIVGDDTSKDDGSAPSSEERSE